MSTSWQNKGRVTIKEAALEILSCSRETVRKMRKAGILRGDGSYVTVTSIQRYLTLVEEGQSPWPVRKQPAAKPKGKDRTGSTKRTSGTSGQSNTTARGIVSLLAGHKGVKVTAEVYSEATMERKRTAVEKGRKAE